MPNEDEASTLAQELEACEIAPFPHALSDYYVVLVDEGLRSRILSALSRTTPVERGEGVEQIISAWAFAHNVDGAARNDLFKRLRALSHPSPGEQE